MKLVGLHTVRVLSLFSGVGGLDLGFKRAVSHARTVAFLEREAYACAVLVARQQEGRLDAAPIHANVETFNGRQWRGKVDCIIGGFPCTDISLAGKQAGFIDANGNRTRSGLWFEYARIIDEVQPRFVFIENVAALARRGLDIVLQSLASLGFDAEWAVRSAAEAGAPHRRERLFLLAWHRDRTSGVGQADAYSLPDERRGGSGDLPCQESTAQGERDQRERSGDPSDDREQALADDDDDGRQGVGGGGLSDGVRGRTERAPRRSDPDGSSGPAAEMGDADRVGECEQDDEATPERDGRPRSRSDAGGASLGPVVNTSSDGRGEGRTEHAVRSGRDTLTGAGGLSKMGDDDERLEGRDGFDDSGERIPWPPGPEDVDGWREYLRWYPDCAPAVSAKPARRETSAQSEFRERSDGMASALDGSVPVPAACLCDRIERLRAAGNGVVPAQAELALRDLIERAGSAANFLRRRD